MLESGCVSVKNEANIMMKNVVDVVFGGKIILRNLAVSFPDFKIIYTKKGTTYWLFGFSMSFGNDPPYSSPFLGFGEYAVDADLSIMGPVFASFMFQLSFATTATTIGNLISEYLLFKQTLQLNNCSI